MLTYNVISDFVEKIKNSISKKKGSNTIEIGGNIEVDGNVVVNGAENLVDKEGNPIVSGGGAELFNHDIYITGTNYDNTYYFRFSLIHSSSDNFDFEKLRKYIKNRQFPSGLSAFLGPFIAIGKTSGNSSIFLNAYADNEKIGIYGTGSSSGTWIPLAVNEITLFNELITDMEGELV